MSNCKLTRRGSQTITFFTFFLIICIFTITYQPNVLNYLSHRFSNDNCNKISEDTEVDLFNELQELLQCSNIDLKSDIHQVQTFWVLENYILPEKRFNCHESITLTTQGDYTFLDNLQVIVERWRGPVSVALYAPGDDFMATLESIAYVRNCQSHLVKELVSFHLFYDMGHSPHLANTTILEAYTDYHACDVTPPYSATPHDNLYKQRNNLTYPINVARNIARRAASTHFVFPTDIELYPSPHFIDRFLRMIADKPSLADATASTPRVFVVPLFEVVAEATVPNSKTELQVLIKGNMSFVFHARLCLRCHKIPKYTEWLKQEEELDTLSVFTTTKRLGYHYSWEPFFVGTNSDPWFDERLTWEGQANKLVQGLIMCLHDYDYMVLDNAFLIHKPGIKASKAQMQKYMNLVSSTAHLMNGQIKYELSSIYGVREGCQWFITKSTVKPQITPKSSKP